MPNQQQSGARRATGPLLCICVLLFCLAGCNTSSSAAGRADATTPRQVLAKLRELRAASKYREMETWIVPERAGEVARTLLAIDGFINANEALVNFVQQNVSPGLARVIDQSYLAQSLDIFSSGIGWLDEVVDGDAATVAFTIEAKIPARHAQLVRVGGSWRYDPGGGFDPAMPAAFDRMALGLRQSLDDLRSGKLSLETLRDDPRRLLEEIRLRLMPGVNMLPRSDPSVQNP